MPKSDGPVQAHAEQAAQPVAVEASEEISEPDGSKMDQSAVVAGMVAFHVEPSMPDDKYTSEDFMWFEDTRDYEDQIVILVNKVERENANCEKADTTSVALSGSRGKPGDPVFFATCDSRSGPFNVWFRPGDADKMFAAL